VDEIESTVKQKQSVFIEMSLLLNQNIYIIKYAEAKVNMPSYEPLTIVMIAQK
jgi:hypothetical protein